MKKILMFVFIVVITLTIKMNIKANQVLPDGIEYLVDGAYTPLLWVDDSTFQSYTLDLDGAGSFSNGLLVGKQFYIRSSNPDLKYIEFRSDSTVSVRFNIYNASYTVFEILYLPVEDIYSIAVVSSPIYASIIDFNYYVYDAYVTLPIKNYTADSNYNDGYDDGYYDGNAIGKIEGNSTGYDSGYFDGYELGLEDGYTDGYDDGLSTDIDVSPVFQNLILFIGNVFTLEIFPGMSIGALASIPIAFALFKWFMRMFGGK